jgi:polysaccharide transporter, PST family
MAGHMPPPDLPNSEVELVPQIIGIDALPRIGAFFEGRPTLSRVAGNVGWLFAERIAMLATGFIVNIWFVRYLGPAQYGLYSYALNFAALFSLLAGLGLDSLIVRNLTRTPEQDGEIIGTSLVLRGVTAALTWMASVATIFVLRDDATTRSMVTVLSVGSLATAATVFDLWFQAQIAVRGVVVARTIVFCLAAAVRCLLILSGARLVTFAILLLLANSLTAAATYWLYRRARSTSGRLRFSMVRARALLADGWPMLIASLSVVVYMKIDQVMLTAMSGNRENGIYAVAVTLSEVWYFLPTAVAATVFPLIVEAYDRKEAKGFEHRMQLFYDGMATLGYSIAIPVALLSRPVVHLLYGPQYARSAGVLSVHVVSFLFVTLGVARARFLLADNLTRFAMLTGVAAAAFNILLNLLLIPRYGALGAAWSTLLAYATANYLTGVLHPRVRRQTWLMSLALMVPLRPKGLWGFVVGRGKIARAP